LRTTVSEVNLFQECEWLWWARYVKQRAPRAFDVAPAAGTFWHRLVAEFIRLKNKPAALEVVLPEMRQVRDQILTFGGTEENVSDYVDLCERLLLLFDLYDDFVGHEKTLFIEKILEAKLPVRYRFNHTLLGIPDRVIEMKDGSIWHVQYKTLSDRTPPHVYVAAAERSLHELAYAFLITSELQVPFSRYGGTVLNVVRKISHRAIKQDSRKAFIQELIPIKEDQVHAALRDIARVADRMESIVFGASEPIQSRAADTNRFGNVLSGYFNARRGTADLDDDRFFAPTSTRYGNGVEDVRLSAIPSGLQPIVDDQ
jgi:RecB family exonuclease